MASKGGAPVYLGDPHQPVSYVAPPKQMAEPKSSACCCCRVTTCVTVLSTVRLVANAIAFVAIIVVLVVWQAALPQLFTMCRRDPHAGVNSTVYYDQHGAHNATVISALRHRDQWVEDVAQQVCTIVRTQPAAINMGARAIAIALWLVLALECVEMLLNTLALAAVAYTKAGLIVPRLAYDSAMLLLGYASVAFNLVVVVFTSQHIAQVLPVIISALVMLWPTYVVYVERTCHKYLKWKAKQHKKY